MTERSLANTRVAPDFIVIGAMRAGTTSIYEWLRSTGRVSLPDMKETDFFLTEENWSKGNDWLKARYSDLSLPMGDISPNYTKRDVWPTVSQRIHQTNPNAKLIFIVRDPVARAVSQYQMMSGMGLVPSNVENFLKLDDGPHITDTSKYAWQLEPYLEYWSIEDIHIVDFGELKSDPFKTVNDMLTFIGVEPLVEGFDVTKANASDSVNALPGWWGAFRASKFGTSLRARAPRKLINRAKQLVSNSSKTVTLNPISPEVKSELAELLRQDVEKFRQMTGRDFSNWSV